MIDEHISDDAERRILQLQHERDAYRRTLQALQRCGSLTDVQQIVAAVLERVPGQPLIEQVDQRLATLEPKLDRIEHNVEELIAQRNCAQGAAAAWAHTAGWLHGLLREATADAALLERALMIVQQTSHPDAGRELFEVVAAAAAARGSGIIEALTSLVTDDAQQEHYAGIYDYDGSYFCVYCRAEQDGSAAVVAQRHEPTCPITMGRVALQRNHAS